MAIWRVTAHARMGVQRASWLGPGMVLATETRVEETGHRRPASIVWVVLNGRLYRCSPQQVRRCSLREVADEEATAERPWTFEGTLSNIEKGDCTDLTGQEEPPEEEVEVEISEEEFLPDEVEDAPCQMDSDEEMIPATQRSLDGTEERPRKRIVGKTPQWEIAERHALSAMQLSESTPSRTLGRNMWK